MVPDIALAASARDWPDRLHRFLLDHGGGRIVDRVMGPDQATVGGYDVLLIDDVSSFLTPRLVTVLKQSSVEVIGVYMPEDGSDAKRRLLGCGISDVIESEATPEEFLAKIGSTLAHRAAAPPAEVLSSSPGFGLCVTGPCEGVGMTEVAISLARSLADEVSTVLVDMDSGWPSIAQRLDLPLHPNIRTALDHALHSVDRLGDTVHEVDGLMVVGGRADGGQGPEISRPDSIMLLDALGSLGDVIVVDLGPMRHVEPGLFREFDTVLVVGTGDPVGVARLIRTAASLLTRDPAQSVLAVVNKTGRGTFRRAEIAGEINRAIPGLPVLTVPFEDRLDQAAWDGRLVDKGRYSRAVHAMSEVVVGSLG